MFKKLTPNLLVADVERKETGAKEQIEALHGRLKSLVPIVKPLVTQWYLITFAERVPADPASA